jgi:hypothetical protein
MRHGGGGESDEHSLKRQAELGRLLAAAEGYRVVASDGASLGWLDHVRYSAACPSLQRGRGRETKGEDGRCAPRPEHARASVNLNSPHPGQLPRSASAAEGLLDMGLGGFKDDLAAL